MLREVTEDNLRAVLFEYIKTRPGAPNCPLLAKPK
jgi:hypothetical protein